MAPASASADFTFFVIFFFVTLTMALIARFARNYLTKGNNEIVTLKNCVFTRLFSTTFTTVKSNSSVKFIPTSKCNLFTVVTSFNPLHHSFSTSATVSSAQNLRKQKSRATTAKKSINDDVNAKQITAFCTADSYNLGLIRYSFSKLLNEFNLPDIEDAIAYSFKTGQVYIFSEGVTVFWNIQQNDQLQLINQLSVYAENPHHQRHYSTQQKVLSVDDLSNVLESDTLSYVIIPNDSNSSRINRKGLITLTSASASLDQYAFSNALALSVKLATWETSLDSYAESIKSIAYSMREGKSIKIKRHVVFQKVGELFSLRSNINLGSDFLGPPDFYWDREDLETLFQNTCSFLSLRSRTNLMNEKLTYCYELLQQLTSHLDQEHNTKLEWMIIILIAVEVLFEIIHFVDKYY